MSQEIPGMSPSQLMRDLGERLQAPIEYWDPLFLTGVPGVGKTEILRQITEAVGLPFWPCRPIQHESVEYTGLPFVRNPDMQAITGLLREIAEGMGVKLKAQVGDDGASALSGLEIQPQAKGCWVPFEELLPTMKDWEGVIFMDEFTQLDVSLQKVGASLLDKEGVAGRRIPRGARFVLAGNRQEDRAGANRLISIIESRCRQTELLFSLTDWQQWAITANIDHIVRSFSDFKGNEFVPPFDPAKKLNPLPRTWVKVSNELRAHPNASTDKDDSILGPAVRGWVGMGHGSEFMAYREHFHMLHNVVDKVFNTPDKVDIDSDPSVQYALIGAISARFGEKSDRLSNDQIGNIVKFARRVYPKSMQALLCVHCRVAERNQKDKKFLKAPEALKWCTEHADTLAAWRKGWDT